MKMNFSIVMARVIQGHRIVWPSDHGDKNPWALTITQWGFVDIKKTKCKLGIIPSDGCR